jgi:hypothetical protein
LNRTPNPINCILARKILKNKRDERRRARGRGGKRGGRPANGRRAKIFSPSPENFCRFAEKLFVVLGFL